MTNAIDIPEKRQQGRKLAFGEVCDTQRKINFDK